MKIAFLTEFSEIGGGESNLLHLSRELHKTNEVALFCPKGALSNSAKGYDLKVYELPHFARKRWVRFIPIPSYPLSLVSRLNQFDVVHVYSLNILPLIFLVKKPVIWTTHGYWERPYGLRGKVIALFVKMVIAVSTDVYNICGFPAHRKKLIFLGTPPRKQTKVKPFEPDNITLSCIGRFQKIKGQDILLDAIQQVGQEMRSSRFTLYFIGDVNGNSREDREFKEVLLKKINRIAQSNIKIFFEGFKKNVQEYIGKSDLVIVPSRYESFSMVSIEALGCGIPVIAPNTGGPKDIINSGKIGMLFNPGDKKNLAYTIIRAIKNYPQFDRAACIKRSQHFSIANQAAQHMVLYRKLTHE